MNYLFPFSRPTSFPDHQNCLDLMHKCLNVDPIHRISSENAFRHRFIQNFPENIKQASASAPASSIWDTDLGFLLDQNVIFSQAALHQMSPDQQSIGMLATVPIPQLNPQPVLLQQPMHESLPVPQPFLPPGFPPQLMFGALPFLQPKLGLLQQHILETFPGQQSFIQSALSQPQWPLSYRSYFNQMSQTAPYQRRPPPYSIWESPYANFSSGLLRPSEPSSSTTPPGASSPSQTTVSQTSTFTITTTTTSEFQESLTSELPPNPSQLGP